MIHESMPNSLLARSLTDSGNYIRVKISQLQDYVQSSRFGRYTNESLERIKHTSTDLRATLLTKAGVVLDKTKNLAHTTRDILVYTKQQVLVKAAAGMLIVALAAGCAGAPIEAVTPVQPQVPTVLPTPTIQVTPENGEIIPEGMLSVTFHFIQEGEEKTGIDLLPLDPNIQEPQIYTLPYQVPINCDLSSIVIFNNSGRKVLISVKPILPDGTELKPLGGTMPNVSLLTFDFEKELYFPLGTILQVFVTPEKVDAPPGDSA